MTSYSEILTEDQKEKLNLDLLPYRLYLGGFYHKDRGRSVWQIRGEKIPGEIITYIPDQEILEYGDADSIVAFIDLKRCFYHG